MKDQNSGRSGLIITIVIAIAAIVGAVWYYVSGDPGPVTTPPPTVTPPTTPPTPNPTPTPNPVPIPTTPPPPTSGRRYEDGTYSATGNYRIPVGDEQVGISITLRNNVVTAAAVNVIGANPTSKQMQAKFQEGFQQFVVGKDIDAITLTVVNGSSLTPAGFMDALAKIKTEARVSS